MVGGGGWGWGGESGEVELDGQVQVIESEPRSRGMMRWVLFGVRMSRG